MQKLYMVFALASIILFGVPSFGQSILNPNDPIVTYNPSSPPTQPPFGQIGKWVRTSRLSWNTSGYKCYIYEGSCFRLYFPKSYNPTANDGKKYPMLVFFHGLGETGTIYDNEYQLYHGGDVFAAAVANGTFDGYVLVMQSQGFWGSGQYQQISDIISYMIVNNKLDPFHIVDNGLSAGGQGTWEMLFDHPKNICASIPMSSVSVGYKDPSVINPIKFTPIWLIQGGQDDAPAPQTAQQVVDAMNAAGSNLTYKVYSTLGHDTWDSTWLEPDFWPFINRAYMSNPWALTGRTKFCPGDPINVTIGVAPGFNAYRWRRNGVVINGAVSNTIQVTDTATYDAQVLADTIWSDWSHTPIHTIVNPPTVTPPITVSGLMSPVIPAADGKNYVTLQVPDNGYVSYTWEKVGSNNVIGTQRTQTVSQPGNYIVSVTEQFGCSSTFSTPFTVVNASGTNAPDPAANLTATTLSYTQVELNWANNPKPLFNETAFEVYRSTSSGGPYILAGIVPADTLDFADNNLTPNIQYFYTVRAVNNNGAASLSNEASAITQSDKIPPTAPPNLRVTSTSTTSIALAWDSATDNVGVTRYLVYVNGIKSYSTAQTSIITGGLTPLQQYSFYVIAEDASNNMSPKSNQVIAAAVFSGLNYNYYTFANSPSTLPDFNSLTPAATGTMPNVNITGASQANNFGYLWYGFINIPVSGTYYLQTNSDDGSDLYLGSLNGTSSPYSYTTTPTVNNDGAHGAQNATSAKLTLTKGVYPIAITYFQQAGGVAMSISWQNPQTGGNYVTIPDSAFVQKPVISGYAPAYPTNITVAASAYNKIHLSWTDKSNNETGFEVYRSATATGTYNIVGTTGPNVISYIDSALSASTTYYYKVQAINQYGSSGFDPASLGGLSYSYYEGTWSNLPNFNSLTPIKTGTINNVSLSPAIKTTNYAMMFQGSINIPTTGNYTFYTKSDDGSDLYIGGFNSTNLVVNNDYLQSATERSGTINLNKGVYPIYITYFQQGGDASLTASYQGPGISKQTIPDVAFQNNNDSATTFPLPAAPIAPEFLKVKALSSSQISLNWTDYDTVEKATAYLVYRSITDSMHFKFLTTLPANSVSYIDTGLFANVRYYYHIAATAIGGTSANNRAVPAAPFDNPPVITQIPDRSARYGVTTVIPVSATDPDGDAISLVMLNKPAFVKFVKNGDGTGTLSLTPKSNQQGVYSNISVIAKDGHLGLDTTTFNLTVNDNYDPVIDTIPDYTLNENDVLSIPLTAHDQNTTDILTWSVNNLPNAFTITSGANGTETISVHPNYSSAGTYNVQVSVSDGNGGSATRHFTITVKDKDPNVVIYAQFTGPDPAGLPWNHITGVTTNNLKDVHNNSTSIGLALQTGAWLVGNYGTTTGNNSGVYPDAVLQDNYYFGIYGSPQSIDTKLTGLDPTRLYNLTFYAGSSWTGQTNNGTTTFTVGTQTVSLNVQGNTQNTVTIPNIAPAADGTITYTMGHGTNTQVGFINSLVLTSYYNDGTAPATPGLLTAQNFSGNGIKLSWQDNAYNETGYEVYRSLTQNGTYGLIGTTPAPDTTSYVDNTVSTNMQYYYKVRAVNSYGASGYSNIAGIVAADRIPVVNAISNVSLKNNQQLTVNVTATDDITDHITLTASNLPPFATFTDNGNGTGSVNINPNGSIGYYSGVTITATDNSDSSSSASFDISVIDKDVSSVYINFSDGNAAPAPWNNIINPPFAGTTVSNLVDDSNTPTSISIDLVSGFDWYSSTGMRPRNGQNIYPEVVMRSGEIMNDNTTKTIQIAGLSASKLYNFVFFNSHDDGLSSLTNYTINGKTVSLNGTYNINKTVEINGIAADANGHVTITVAKDASASYGFISSLVIQSYTASTTPLSPSDLRVISNKSTSVSLQWADRSSNETSFQISRATSSAGPFTSLATVSAGTVSYTDNNLTPNTTYYYTVRSVVNSTYSSYSNVATVTTYSYAVYVNPTATDEAPAPWNNLNAPPQLGYTWNNFVDQSNSPTSIGMVETGTFAGDQTLGMNTGNNSGIFPDNVMIDNYLLFPGTTGSVKLTGLNLNMTYDLTFFGSTQAYGDANTAFIINNQTTIATAPLLNASQNESGTITIYNIKADQNGEINISVAPGTPTSIGGYFGAVIVQGHNQSTATPPQPSLQAKTPPVQQTVTQVSASKNQPIEVAQNVGIYPNPFDKYFTLNVPSEGNDNVEVMIYSVKGQLVYQNKFGNLVKGDNSIRVETNQNLVPGMYLVKVLSSGKETYKVIKLIKQ